MSQLFTAPAPELVQDLLEAHAAVSEIFPLKNRHKNELPYAVRDLSLLLTQERGQSRRYWTQPRFMAAYLYYFLPWNLQRLTRLFPELPLTLEDGDQMLDLGSGPLTIPVGLWLSRPELRAKNLRIVCSDPAPHPMELGRGLQDALARKKGLPPWQISLLRAPLDLALRKARGKMRLITAGNVLNELSFPHQQSLEEHMDEIFASMDRILEPGGMILLLEPGTRLGGKLVALMRSSALAMGYTAERPCPHQNACPFLSKISANDPEGGIGSRSSFADHGACGNEKEIAPAYGRRPRPEARKGYGQPRGSWCHFSLPALGGAPELMELTRLAKLEKERLHLSFVLLRKADGQKTAPELKGVSTKSRSFPVRVISDAIKLPESTRPARYACSARGLTLLPDAGNVISGELVSALLPDNASHDPKSGAIIMHIKK